MTRNWIQPVHDNYCTKGAITASADGSKVFAALKGKAYVLDGANGNFLANKTISNLTDCNGVVTIGSNLYVVGTSKGTTSVDSVSIAGPAITGNYAALVKFGLSGNTATAVLGTWVGSDEYRAFPYSLAPAYDGSGNANRLLLGLELGGSTLLSGTGYSEAYSTKPVNVTARFTYGVG